MSLVIGPQILLLEGLVRTLRELHEANPSSRKIRMDLHEWNDYAVGVVLESGEENTPSHRLVQLGLGEIPPEESAERFRIKVLAFEGSDQNEVTSVLGQAHQAPVAATGLGIALAPHLYKFLSDGVPPQGRMLEILIGI